MCECVTMCFSPPFVAVSRSTQPPPLPRLRLPHSFRAVHKKPQTFGHSVGYFGGRVSASSRIFRLFHRICANMRDEHILRRCYPLPPLYILINLYISSKIVYEIYGTNTEAHRHNTARSTSKHTRISSSSKRTHGL